MLPAGSIIRTLYHMLQTQFRAPEDGRNYRPKQVELIEIINKQLLLQLVDYLCYWQMGFNSVFKGLKRVPEHHTMKACRGIRGKYVHIIDFGRNHEKRL